MRNCSISQDFQRVLKTIIIGALALTLTDCSSYRPSSSLYPQEWWLPVDRTQAASWEILPQDAKPGEVILSKRTRLGVLSNFASTPFVFRKKNYASLEGFWQSLLYPEDQQDPRARYPGLKWKFKRSEVEQMTGFEAKNAGKLAKENMKIMNIDWVSFEGRRMTYKPLTPGDHYKLIVEATWEKVKQNPVVKETLLSTGNLQLKPDHTQDPDVPAAWRYYDIYMQIRTELQQQTPTPLTH